MTPKNKNGVQDLKVPWDALSNASQIADYASEYTHPLYRYPASLSPSIARALILGLTKPGQVVLDPFCGGGTTAIEALAHGRLAICTDINSLACFVTTAKARVPTRETLTVLRQWIKRASSLIEASDNLESVPLVLNDGVQRSPRTHGVLVALRDMAFQIPNRHARRIALLMVLRLGQLCFDCRSKPPNPRQVTRHFRAVSSQALTKYPEYIDACYSYGDLPRPSSRLKVFQVDASEASAQLRSLEEPVTLIATSPPYPGVHVLYHRWQIRGRRETTLPYSLVGLQDGHFESHYTLGPRKERDNRSYFDRLERIYSELRSLLRPSSIVAQVVGFSDPDRQLDQFHATMARAGYAPIENGLQPDAVITRTVPNRRWYAVATPNRKIAQEYLLLHQPTKS